METKKKAKKEHPLLKHRVVKEWLTGLEKQTKYGYLSTLKKFCEHAKKTPDRIIAERKADKEKKVFRYEEIALSFFDELKGPEGKHAGSAKVHLARLQSFFDYHRAPLDFTREQKKRISKSAAPVYIDYVPMRDDIIKMCEVADARDRAITLTAASAPLSEDLCHLTRAQFEHAVKIHMERVERGELSKDDPVCLAPHGGFLYRGKTKVKMRPFLAPDAVQADKAYLRTRRDDAPWLFVSKNAKKLNENELNQIIKRLAERAGLVIPETQRIRLHAFRKMFNDVANNCDITHDWICILYGHKIKGSEDFYTMATENRLREKFKRMVPHISVSRAQNMVIIRNQFDAALEDHVKEEFKLHLRQLGKTRFKQLAEETLAIQPSIKWDPSREMEPAIYRTQRVLREILNEISGRSAKRE